MRRRLSKLLQDRVIRVIAVAEPERLGYHTSAFIGLQVNPARVESVATELAALAETEHAAITTGSYSATATPAVVAPTPTPTPHRHRLLRHRGVPRLGDYRHHRRRPGHLQCHLFVLP